MSPDPFIVDGAVFVLDRDANPHPVMREKALNLRRLARMAPGVVEAYLPWHGYRECMCDATGLPPEQIEAWLDWHDPFPVPVVAKRAPTSTRVDVTPRNTRLGGPKDRP